MAGRILLQPLWIPTTLSAEPGAAVCSRKLVSGAKEWFRFAPNRLPAKMACQRPGNDFKGFVSIAWSSSSGRVGKNLSGQQAISIRAGVVGSRPSIDAPFMTRAGQPHVEEDFMAGYTHLFIPGPTNIPEEVRQAMNLPMEDMRAASFP
ncbi:hypothetical protein RFN30_31800, partial [Mesorhizobium sp. VK23D]|nr:hypothetical protein [Mesorhizobium sp. VK23D]